jgi:hypothetical protein
MAVARIYRPAKSAMQSGWRNTRHWVLEFEPAERKQHDHLMGWVGSGDTQGQVRLSFDTRQEAVAFAKRHGLVAQVREPHERRPGPKSYADNFRYDRIL